MAEPKVSILLTLVDKLTAPVEGAKGKLASFGEAVTGVGAKIAALGVSAALGVFFKSAVEEATKAEASTIRLGHAVRNAGEDFDTWAPQIDATIAKLAKLTTFTDDDLAAALGDLITKTGDVAGSLKNMGLVTDLAANKNISLDESATLVAKAINGGGRLFKEYGITAGTAAEKTEQLAQILAGSAAAAADSFGGRVHNLGKAWDELKEGVGKAIIENAAIGDALASLSVLIDELAPKVASFVAFIVSDVVTSIQRFVEDVQKFGAGAANAILGVPDRFKLAWGNLMVAIANSIGESRVLLTIFGDGLTKIADTMGANGVRMVQDSQKNLRNLRAGYDETVAGIGKTVAKGEDDKTKTTQAGHRLRLEGEQKAAKDTKEVLTKSQLEWEALQAKFTGTFEEWTQRRRDIEAEAARATKAAWGLSYDYIIEQINRTIAVQRTGAAVSKAAWSVIVDGLDGVYGAAEKVPPKVKDISDETFNAARGAISLGKEFGAIDETAASVLNNVVNLADTLKDGLKGISAGNLVGAIGSLAGIMGSIFGSDPAHAALVRKNTERLAELKDRLGEVLEINAPGRAIAAVQGLDFTDVFSQSSDTNGNVSAVKLSAYLAGKGLSLSEFRQIAKDTGIDLGEKNGHFDAGAVRDFLAGFKDAGVVGFDSSLGGLVGRSDFLTGITGGGAGDQLSGIAAALSSGSGSSALGGLFSGLSLGDGIDPTEAAMIRQRTVGLASRFAGGQVSAAEMGGASNAEFIAFIRRIVDLLDSIASTNATTAGAVTGGGIGAVSDTDMATSFDLSTAAVGG